MSNSVKLTLYIALAILACVSAIFALKAFGRLMEKGRPELSELEQIEPEKKEPPPESATTPAPPVTPDTNAPATNAVQPVENTSTAPPTNPPSLTETNPAAAALTNSAGTTGITNHSRASKTPAIPNAIGGHADQNSGKKSSHLGLWSAVFVLSLVGLGLLIANDVSHYFGNKALKVIYNDEGEGVANPEYESAEQVWANGDHLEAIRLMREYLNKNPREQYVALRIAEIYEKDLKNYLAAALEYEEILKHKLPPERWGWAAIHVCNLYFKLDQEQKAYDLLKRIVKEYGNTPAADKARKRLEQVGQSSALEEMTESQVDASPQSKPAPQTAPEPPSNLPPGFRPKK